MTGRSEYTPARIVDYLVRTALSPNDAAKRAWAAWKDAQKLDQASWAEIRMLGAVAARIDTLETDPDIVPRIKGIRKFLWANTEDNLRGAQTAIGILTARHIPCLMLKGAARIAQDPRAAVERLIRDVDVLVPYERAVEAFDVLVASGWALDDWQPQARSNGPRQAHHAWGLKRGKSEFDLHHYSNFLNRLQGDDDGLWERARKAEWRGLPVLLPDPSDGLIIALAHGVRKSGDGAADWAVDAAALLKQDQIDWRIFEAEVRDRMLEGLVHPALAYLQDVTEVHAPSGLMDRMRDRISPLLHNEAQVYATTDWPSEPTAIDAMFQGANLRACTRATGPFSQLPMGQLPSQTNHAKPERQTLIQIGAPGDLMPDRPATLYIDAKWPSEHPPQSCDLILESPGIVLTRAPCDIRSDQGLAGLDFAFRLSSGLLRRREIDRIWIKLEFAADPDVPDGTVTFRTHWRF